MWSPRSIYAGWCAAAALLLACSSSPTEPPDDPPPGELVVTPRVVEVTSGSIRRFKVTVQGENRRQISIKGVSWLSSNDAVARVDQQGTLTAGQAGTAQVTARWNGSHAVAMVIVTPSSTPGCSNLQLSARASASVAIPCQPQPQGPGGKKRPSDLR